MLKFQILLYLISLSVEWQSSNIMSIFTQQTNQTNLRDYYLTKTTFSGNDYLLIFGGRSSTNISNQTIFSNSLYSINLTTQQAKQLAINKTRPSPRYNSCGTIVRERLYIYGGYTQNNGTPNNQLWEYELLNDEWSLRGTSQTMDSCDFMITTNLYVNDTVTLVGLLENSRSLHFVQYLIFNKTFITNLTVNVYNSVELNTKLWDGSFYTSYLRLQQQYDEVGDTTTSKQQVHLPVKYFCLIPTTNNTNLYTMVTNNGIYTIQKTDQTYSIKYSSQKNMQQSISKINCLSINEWDFVIYPMDSQSQPGYVDIYVEYVHELSQTTGIIHKDKTTLYVDWIQPVISYGIFMQNNSIYIVNENLQIFYLSEDCSNFLTQNQNILRCSFGMYSCKERWTGDTCSIPDCSQSLRLYDANNFTEISIECSGNGQCTAQGCKCQQNWIGERCDIYQKKNCQGTLIPNFIESNCQCNQPTTGGNQCTVVFCYNDCSDHGECQQDGTCSCDEGYKGPDCSILEINFDRI